MKRVFIFLALFISAGMAFASDAKIPATDDQLDYAEIVNSIDSVGAPFIKGDYVVFTAEHNMRHVGIAFDFEEYKTIHSFQIKKFVDMEYNESGSICFFIKKLPKKNLGFNYRLIIDGLWTVDPYNPDTVFDRKTNLTLSHVDASRYIPPVTEKHDDGLVHFVYRGKSGEQVRIGGSFTNWDSWIYTMTEVSPGLYEFALPLPPGKYEYAFYNGITSFPDKGNPERCYTSDGKVASLLVVN
ncbi:MAG: glycogen-binding domain-containing protein [Treponema sp.]|nr:glycogen-binding domain-containing protein [Spirochaetia bacterium]MDD7459039.1 glycogen-binding domain-containing protein [Spirochaetales bacterium]MDY5811739.1 glycogen-binding domain-containing protein [Treponema sp.]MEE1180890.1 glycogen-binding domain-containing protein [Treponema sp.]